MAFSKRKVANPEGQAGLSFGGPSLQPSPVTTPEPLPSEPCTTPAASIAEVETAADLDPEELDDYDEAPRLHLVDPPRKVSVIVEAVADRFEVSRLRDNGTTVAHVMYTRSELEELISRAQAALEM